MSHEREPKSAPEGFRGRHVFYAFVGGAAAGAAAAFLTARESGAQLRARLRKSGEQGIDRARHLPQAFKDATVAAEKAFIAAMEEGQPEPTHKHRESAHRH